MQGQSDIVFVSSLKRKLDHFEFESNEHVIKDYLLSSPLIQPSRMYLTEDEDNHSSAASSQVKRGNSSPRSCSSDDDMSSSVKRNDRRKNNKGSAHRKSYSIDVKKRAVLLRDNGVGLDEVARMLDTAKSNVEKWCSSKVNNIYFFEFIKTIFY